MSNKQTQKATKEKPTPGEVDRIRDIIFGPQTREYDQKFQTLQRDLSRFQQDLDRLAEQQAEQNSQQAKKTQDLRQEVRQADDDLRGELRQTAQKLTTDKVDRLALGELFVDLGNHLKTGASDSQLSDWLTQLQDHTETE